MGPPLLPPVRRPAWGSARRSALHAPTTSQPAPRSSRRLRAIRLLATEIEPEFKAAFAAACQALGIRHTRTLPRHAWTNRFVERLQGTILHEHWRIAFRRQYFTSRHALQRSLDAFMTFYNEQRPRQGYRLRGQTPAELFTGGGRPRELMSWPALGSWTCQHHFEC